MASLRLGTTMDHDDADNPDPPELPDLESDPAWHDAIAPVVGSERTRRRHRRGHAAPEKAGWRNDRKAVKQEMRRRAREARTADTSGQQRRQRRSKEELVGIWGLVAASALLGALAAGEPTGNAVVDVLWRGAFAALVTGAASRSRRWPWLWLAGLALAGSLGTWWALVAAAAFAIGLSASLLSKDRARVLGAVVGLLSVQALLRMPSIEFHGLMTVVAAVAVAPVLWSAYERSHREGKRRIRAGIGIAFVGLGLAAFGFVFALTVAVPRLQDGHDDTLRGRDIIGTDTHEAAAAYLEAAASDFDDAGRAVSGWWTLPAQLVPIASQHLDVLGDAAEAGHDLDTTAAETLRTAPYQDLRPAAGQIDLAVVEEMQGPVAESVAVLERAQTQLASVNSPWLLGPLGDRLDDFAVELSDAVPEAEFASEVLDVTPAMLGGSETREYLVLFTSPAEARFLGGFVGAYGILTAQNGDVTFTESGPIDELNYRVDPASRVLPELPELVEYRTRHDRYSPALFLQNLTASPDFPTDAVVARELMRQTTGIDVDGVIMADPDALAGFLELTGPVDVPGVGRMNSRNVVDYLLVEQYTQFPDDNDERRDNLGLVADATFDALTSRELPRPVDVGDALSPSVTEKRLLVHMFDEDEQAVFDHIGASGAFEPPESTDFLSLRTANAGPNKLDTYLDRKVDYNVDFDSLTGRTTAIVEVTLTNNTPPGLPEYVTSNRDGYPLGTNVTYLSLYTPLLATSVTENGLPVAVSWQEELGAQVFSREVAIPAAHATTLSFVMEGYLAAGDYALTLLSQPTVRDDQFALTLTGPGSVPPPQSGLNRAGAALVGEATITQDRVWDVLFGSAPPT